MNGAESLIRTALDAGIEVCFANPGTTEMPLVAALDAVEGMRAVLGLFEGVCTGAADGYERAARAIAGRQYNRRPGDVASRGRRSAYVGYHVARA